jgi:hypothetical protein
VKKTIRDFNITVGELRGALFLRFDKNGKGVKAEIKR